MTINREHFEAWLFSQPKDRQLNYLNDLANAQRIYLSLFPDPQAVSCGDGNETLPSKKQN